MKKKTFGRKDRGKGRSGEMRWGVAGLHKKEHGDDVSLTPCMIDFHELSCIYQYAIFLGYGFLHNWMKGWGLSPVRSWTIDR